MNISEEEEKKKKECSDLKTTSTTKEPASVSPSSERPPSLAAHPSMTSSFAVVATERFHSSRSQTTRCTDDGGGGAEQQRRDGRSVHQSARTGAQLVEEEKKKNIGKSVAEEGRARGEVEEEFERPGASGTMQQAADYFRPYSLASNAAAAAAAGASSPVVAAAQHHQIYYPSAALAAGAAAASTTTAGSSIMSPNTTTATAAAATQQRLMQSPPAVPSSSFTINISQQAAATYPAAAAAAYLGHPHHYGAGYATGFEYAGAAGMLPPTTHIPLDPFQQQQQRLMNYPARPQPTRPIMVGGDSLKAGFGGSDSMAAPQTPPLNRTSSSSLLKDKINNNSNSTSSNNSNNNHSPQAANSPASAGGGPLSPATGANPADRKFRYPSGTTNSVQSSTSPHVGQGGGERVATPSSAMSSREGTPLPAGVKLEESAPNVDISRVQIKDGNSFSMPHSDFSPPPPPSTTSSSSSSAFAQHSNNSFLPGGMQRPRGYGTSVGSFYSSSSTGSMDTMDQQHCVTIPQRSAGSSGAASSASSAGPSAHHGHVKIGRRPAHLPKVLKFSDKTLPPGWIRKLKQRKHGKQAGRWDVYIYSPCGVKFASRKKLKGFFEKNNLNYDPEDFDFTPYGRHIDSRAASGGHLSTSASRHNSSGSTGSDGTHPGSSPASITNYSPTHHSSPYLMGHHHHHHIGPTAGGTPSGLSAVAVSTGFGDYNSFAQFDPHMENPPNASALDVPSGTASGAGANEFSTGSATLPYHHLGRGHHHPIVNKDAGGVGSEFFPSAEMADILGGGHGSAPSSHELHNGFSSSSSYDPRTTTASGLQPLSNASMSSRTSGEEENEDMKPIVRPSTAQSVNTSSASNSMQTDQQNNQGNNGTAGQQDRFSLGRTMSVLQANQDGFEDYGFY